VLNVGSGGNSFDIPAHLHIHVDLALSRLRNKVGIVANAESIPLRNACIDFAICVGSVINHGNGYQMLAEIARVLRPNARVVLEFDCADGLHQGVSQSQGDYILVETFFNRQMLTLIEYSRSYIEQGLQLRGFAVEHRYSFHIISALMLRLGMPPQLAAGFIHLDGLARIWKSLRYRGSNLLIVARRV
jgi:SAM-dependent methyltransferase